MSDKWYKSAFRRCVVDMHINDWSSEFLSQFDAHAFVETVKKSCAQSIVLYAHSHVGLTNYPTRHGKMHDGLNGRDIFRETAAECRSNGIAVQLYFSLIFDTWAYRTHPDWRVRHADGSGVADSGRYGCCCPNSGYRHYVVDMIEELCDLCGFDGIRFDMTFWPNTCYCLHCRNRFHDETGYELPTLIDWNDPVWVAFQRKREEWLTEFAKLATDTVKRRRPDASIEHQSSTFALPWTFGVSWHLAEQSTFLQGDFYGDILQGSVARKLFHNLTPERPFGFETTFCVNLKNHTAKKSEDWLRCKAFAAMADGGAFVFIDAIDPVGTLNPAIHECMGRIFQETRPYEPFLGGERVQDVALYLSTESKHNPADSGLRLIGGNESFTNHGTSTGMPHVEALFGAADALIRNHIPYGVLTRKGLPDLGKFKVLVLPNVLMMHEDEVQAIRDYVAAGGIVYASKYTSLQKTDGTHPGNYMLADVFGITYEGETRESFTYLAPTPAQAALFDGYTAKHPLGMQGTQLRVSAAPGAETWGTTVLPYSDPADWQNFTSIHSDPPGIPTQDPAIVVNAFGKGKVVYVTTAIEESPISQDLFVALLRAVSPRFSFAADAPPAVEITAFHQPENKRYILNLLNFQKQLPNIPVDDIVVRLDIAGRRVARVSILPSQEAIDYKVSDGQVRFAAPRLHTFVMCAVDYE